MLLKRAAEDPLPSQLRDDAQPPAIITEEGDQEYQVEKILGVVRKGRRTKLRVKWVGYVRPTMEPLENFLESAALDDWEAVNGPITGD